MISIKNLTKTFGTGHAAVTALSDVSLDIEKGEIFGVIGLSGAGKSTLVRCINLLEKPTYGSVIVNGQDLTTLSDAKLRLARRDIGMIFQGFNLLMQKTAQDNVAFPLTLCGIGKKESRKKALELLSLVGLKDKAKSWPAQLSGGQMQRVAIARALATDPSVLLCDEATSALDPATTDSILELLRDINRRLGVTIVVITHDMRVIEQICSRVAIISDSKVAEVGYSADVFRKPKTDAARSLVLPPGERLTGLKSGGELIRLAFDGSTSDRPVIAEMVLKFGQPVNIVYADTRVIEGRIYGHTIIRLPDDRDISIKMQSWLTEQEVSFTKED
ncbi:MAG: ATP-binding cassette domain-containing protein [Ruminococcaceae bacterium]|nr:ATP-binding cassette domain-containing protein [Oscillospiraceae bacterium]